MTILPDPPLADNGDALRDAALELLRTTRPEMHRRLQRAAVMLAIESGRVTADDVRAVVPIPSNVNPKICGSVFRELAKTRILAADGFLESQRAVAHCRPIRIWRLADAAAASRWLAANPEILEVTD